LPALFGLLIGYLLSPIHRIFCNKLKLNSSLSALLITLLFLSALVLGLSRLIPAVYNQVAYILSLLPDAIKSFELRWLPSLQEYLAASGLRLSPDLTNRLGSRELFGELSRNGAVALEGLWAATPVVIGRTFNLALIPIILFFVLRDGGRLITAIYDAVPRDVRMLTQAFVAKMDQTLSAVLIGQAMIAGILTVIYTTAFALIGLPFGAVIGLVAGVCRIVPYLDVVVGLVLSLIVILTGATSLYLLLWVGLVFLVVQSFDGMFLTPRIIGMGAGLHPAIVLLSVLSFANWFGFWGVLFAVPVVALIRVICSTLLEIYRGSVFFAHVETDVLELQGQQDYSQRGQ
jgi:predicted PurR-regulated permease PerM